MLIRLLPEQVSEGWDLFAPLIQEALHPHTAINTNVMVNILRSVLIEDAQAWLEISEKQGPRAFVLTRFDYDHLIGIKRLEIYTLTVIGGEASREEWKKGLKVLETYARKNGCDEIIMQVVDPRFEKFLRGLGVDVDTTLMRLEV